jgi:hypothetical protein
MKEIIQALSTPAASPLVMAGLIRASRRCPGPIRRMERFNSFAARPCRPWNAASNGFGPSASGADRNIPSASSIFPPAGMKIAASG